MNRTIINIYVKTLYEGLHTTPASFRFREAETAPEVCLWSEAGPRRTC
jgi:hypothetical protein